MQIRRVIVGVVSAALLCYGGNTFRNMYRLEDAYRPYSVARNEARYLDFAASSLAAAEADLKWAGRYHASEIEQLRKDVGALRARAGRMAEERHDQIPDRLEEEERSHERQILPVALSIAGGISGLGYSLYPRRRRRVEPP